MSKPISVQLYQPHQNQKIIHDSINNESFKYYVLNIGRQFGKSLLATNQCLYWAFNVKCDIGWISPIYNQANKVYEQTVKAFSSNPSVIKKKDGQKLKIEFCNGSVMQFFSAERYDNIRGFTFDYLVCDEFAFMDEKAWTEVLRATVLVKGKKVLLISTPKGKNHFYLIHALGGSNPQYKSYTMTSYDGLASKDEIDSARYTLPENVFRQEYLAEFIDGGAQLFAGLEEKTADITSNGMYAGIDVGRADDYTVLTIFNNKGLMVYCERWRQNSWANIVKFVAAKLIEYKADSLIEVNSIGDAVFEMLQNEVKGDVSILPFVTTSKSKQDIIEQFMVAVQNKETSIVPTDWLKKEFEVFTYEYNPKTRAIKYSAPSGFHDDGVMATAIGYQAYKQHSKIGVYDIM